MIEIEILGQLFVSGHDVLNTGDTLRCNEVLGQMLIDQGAAKLRPIKTIEIPPLKKVKLT